MTYSVRFTELFNLIHKHGITLLPTELEEIVQVCNRITEREKPARRTPMEKVVTDVLAGMYGIGGIPSKQEFYEEFDMRIRAALGAKPEKKVIIEVLAERKRQNRKWGEQNHTVIEWIPILTKEVVEAAKEAVDFYFRNPVKNGLEKTPATDTHQAVRLQRYRKELIQVAAVAVQAIESLDRNSQ